MNLTNFAYLPLKNMGLTIKNFSIIVEHRSKYN